MAIRETRKHVAEYVEFLKVSSFLQHEEFATLALKYYCPNMFASHLTQYAAVN